MGIFCLETAAWNEKSWEEKLVDHDSMDQDSYDHFLRFLETSSGGRIPYRHYDVATQKELVFYLEKWKEQKVQKHFPVLLLAFHGDQKGLSTVGDETTFLTENLVEILEDVHHDNAIIHFSSCYFTEDTKMKDLLYNTGSLSVSGYMNEKGVGWYTSVAFELLYLVELFEPKLPRTPRQMQKFVDSRFAANKEMKALGESLRFHMWYRVDEDNSNKHTDYATPCPVEELEAEYGGEDS